MKYTSNIIKRFRFAENIDKQGGGIMKSQFASELTMRIWIDFKSHFKSQTTEASYQSDLDEIMEYTGKDFLKLSCTDVDDYYHYMKERVEEGQLKGSTAAKKFRELHSFAQYICERKEEDGLQPEFSDLYEPYLQLMEKQGGFSIFSGACPSPCPPFIPPSFLSPLPLPPFPGLPPA